MSRERVAKRGVVAGALASFAIGLVCLACILPGIGAVVGISVLVTAVGGVAEDGVLTVVGVATLAISLALGAYVLVARRRSGRACAVEELDLASESNE